MDYESNSEIQNSSSSKNNKSISNEKFADSEVKILNNPVTAEKFIIEETSKVEEDKKWNRKMFYENDDVPSWYMTIFLGFQHYLLMTGTIVSVPLLLRPAMCMQKDDRELGNIISTYLFVSGIATILQTTFGTRLPIVQGGSFTFVTVTLAILETEEWKCPDEKEISMNPEIWKKRIRLIQGGVIFSSIFQILLGFFGVFGFLMKYISPITMATTIITIGISLFNVGSFFSSKSWPISLVTIILLILLSQYLRDVKIPIPYINFKKRNEPLLIQRYPLFQIFPVLLTIILVWSLCAILTATGALNEDHPARTDNFKWENIKKSEYFRVPFPFQWGMPIINTGATVGFLSAVFTGIIESIGDYNAVARITGARTPPSHAINRGILIEGFGCLLAGIFGTGNGTTSYSENTGAISLTKVGSRRVVQTAGFIMMICSLVAKLGAFFMSIPDPIVGGVITVAFSVIIAVGLSNLHSVDMTSTRNMFIIGFSVFFSLSVSKWSNDNKKYLKTGYEELDYTIQILLTTSMFQAGLISLILDNTIPGTLQERGIVKKEEAHEDDEIDGNDIEYDLPFIMGFLKRFNWTSWLPISPTFKASIYSNLFRNLFKKNK